MYFIVVTLDTAPHAAWFVLLLLLFMMVMDRRVGDGVRMRQAKEKDGKDTNERRPRVALLTIPSGDVLIEGGGVPEHVSHGRHTRYWPQHAAWFVLLLLLFLFMMTMDRRVGDEARTRQAKGIDGKDTNERSREWLYLPSQLEIS